MNLAVIGAYYLIAASGAQQDPTPEAVLAKFGLKPTIYVTAVDGKATIAPGETIDFVGACDLAEPIEKVWNADGRLLDGLRLKLFWDIMGLPADVKREYGRDEDKRTFAMAFQLSANLTEANDVREDVNKTFTAMLSQTRPAVSAGALVGEMRIIRPVLPKDYAGTTFDFRLEVPGGEWVKIAEFPFGPDTTLAEGAIDIKQRWQALSDFRTVDDRQIIVDYKGYYFTLTLPSALRDMELDITTNDPREDARLLPAVVKQHIRGEDQHAAFKGKDLFLVYGLNSRSESRKFTLRARPRRIAEFKGVPFKRE